jgi:chromosome segregation ATPase
MIRRAALVLLLLTFSSALFGQATATDSQTLQALLAEVRELRKDLQTSAIAARQAQILIYRLHIQQAAVEQATGRLDAAKSRTEQLQNQKHYQEWLMKQNESSRDQAQDDAQRTQIENTIAQLKAQIENIAQADQEAQGTQIGLEEQVRMEQAKMNRLESELDELDRAVMNAALRQGMNQTPTAKLQ